MPFVAGAIKRATAIVQRRAYSRYRADFSVRLTFSDAVKKYEDRNTLYAYMHHYLIHLAPDAIREHRRYYSQNGRGYGEDAFHAMWWMLLQEYKPKLALEIGVYRGQVTSLMGLVATMCQYDCEVHGISPFSPAADGVSSYRDDVDYLQDTLASNRLFGLPDPFFLQVLSTDAAAIKHIKSRKWDLIYIDGNHDYEVVLNDYDVCCNALAEGGLLVMDDSSLYTDYAPPRFAFAGHPGPSRVAQERAFKDLRFLGGVGHNNVFMRI
jgi:predicted O-methyltransferase YrrM